MAARYWKLAGLSARGGGNLELAEIALMNGAARIDTGATASVSITPVAGSLANLADSTSAGAQWDVSAVSSSGFAIQWDFGSAVDVTSVVFTAAAFAATFVYAAELYSSTDGVQWVQVFAYEGFTYPGNGALLTVPVSPVGDPNWNKVSLMLHMNGANGATVIQDSSLYNRAGVNAGSPSLSNAQSKFGGTSLLLNGTNSLVSVEHPGMSADFTCEAWVYFPAAPGTNCAILSIGGWELYRSNSSSGLSLWGLSANRIMGATAVTMNAWHHVAWCRVNGVHTIYLNGASQGTYADTTVIAAGALVVGAHNATEWFKGHIDELRVTNGVSRYNGNFTPPTQEFPTADMALLLRRTTSQFPATTISNQSPPAGPTVVATPKAASRLDMQDGGTGTVSGTVKEKNAPANTPLARKVRLFEEASGRMIQETWSDKATGNYVFTELNTQQRYTVVAYDYLNNYRAVIADNVSPT